MKDTGSHESFFTIVARSLKTLVANKSGTTSNSSRRPASRPPSKGDGRRTAPAGDEGKVAKSIEAIRRSNLFDAAFYLTHNPSAKAGGMDPIEHYVRIGRHKHFEVNSTFSLKRFWATYPAVREICTKEDIDPLEYFVTHGMTKGLILPGPSLQIEWVSPVGHKNRPDSPIRTEMMLGKCFPARFNLRFGRYWRPRAALPKKAAVEIGNSGTSLITPTRPDVSIVIPVYGETAHVLNCLDSLSRHFSKYSVEIIVVDDASPAKWKLGCLDAIPWIRLVRRAENGGFIAACNEGAALAQGKYLVLLNSDVRVAQDWLDELIGSFDTFPKAGCVGSKLFYRDGLLQEAGASYFHDASGRNNGRGGESGRPAYCYARQVDYCSGASIALPLELWRELGGFDPAFAPSYYEDGDLGFRVRAVGREVWFQPLSRVLHYDGGTHTSDQKSKNMAKNREILLSRWGSELAKRGTADMDVDVYFGRRMLVVDSRTPRPDQDSGSYMTDKLISAFQQLGFQITFVPASLAYDADYTARLQRRGVECIYRPFVDSLVSALQGRKPFDYALIFRPECATVVMGELERMGTTTRTLYHTVDLHFLRQSREASLRGNAAGAITAERTKSLELELIARADCAIVHTDDEKRLLATDLSTNNVLTFSYVADIVPSDSGIAGRDCVMFLGGFAHPPNVDGVLYFVEEIWPQVSAALPMTRLLIVGSAPPASVRDLKGPSITVTGGVPELAEYFQQTRVFVAPLRYGAGIKGKVVQSLAHGVPVVATPIAAEGFGFISGRDAIVADDAATFAKAVIDLFLDQDRWQMQRDEGYRLVRERYSWDTALELCRETLRLADATWLRRERHRRRQKLDELTAFSGQIPLL